MPRLIFLFSDQLSLSISSLLRADKEKDIVFLCEVKEEALYVKHHIKKIAFWFASMRHFANELKELGYNVVYSKLDDYENTQKIETEILRIYQKFNASELLVTEPSEWRTKEKLELLSSEFAVPVVILEDNRFLCKISEFDKWRKGKTQIRMEYFYRYMRKKYDILLNKDKSPLGGKWNYDLENRKPPIKGLISPKRISHQKSEITKTVLNLVQKEFADNFGELHPFHFALTRAEALIEAKHFIDELLPRFGDYQDAMVASEAFLYHSLLSTYINAGLLLPLELCQMAETAYHEGLAPLNAVEGYIRQILGWREYVRGIYWAFMPDYKNLNFFGAKRNLPDFYWTGNTDMNCMAEAIDHTIKHSYSHHIQRLMVTGNFALLCGLDPAQVCNWYLIVYADAYEWVELPNTLGMALHGDGGIMASKPYAASGKYINRMSNFCKNCKYNPNETTGENACPFNYLYWYFISSNKNKLINNHRMPYIYSSWEKFDAAKKSEILIRATEFLNKL